MASFSVKLLRTHTNELFKQISTREACYCDSESLLCLVILQHLLIPRMLIELRSIEYHWFLSELPSRRGFWGNLKSEMLLLWGRLKVDVCCSKFIVCWFQPSWGVRCSCGAISTCFTKPNPFIFVSTWVFGDAFQEGPRSWISVCFGHTCHDLFWCHKFTEPRSLELRAEQAAEEWCQPDFLVCIIPPRLLISILDSLMHISPLTSMRTC